MKLDTKRMQAGVHAGLLDILSAEDPALGNESPDTRSLAARLLELAMLEDAGGVLPGQYDAEIDHRSRLLCSIADLETKGKWARVARAVQCYRRAIVAAVAAVTDAGDEE